MFRVLGLTILLLPAAPAATIALNDNGLEDVANLKQLALAMLNYHDTFNRFPAEYIGPSGTPLLSWRVALLPFLGEASLYSQFDLTKAWDDPANLPLLSQMPSIFRSPLDPAASTDTRYAVGVDPNSVFPGSPGVRIADIIDGTSNTLLIGETEGSAIPWTKPEDITVGSCPALGGSGFSSIISGAVPFAFADGSVRGVSNSIGCSALRQLFLRNDGAIADPSVILDFAAPEPSTLSLMAAAGLLAAKSRRRIHARGASRRSQAGG